MKLAVSSSSPIQRAAPRRAAEAAEEIVLSHDFDLLIFVLQVERLGRIAGDGRAASEHGRIDVAHDENIGSLGGDAASVEAGAHATYGDA